MLRSKPNSRLSKCAFHIVLHHGKHQDLGRAHCNCCRSPHAADAAVRIENQMRSHRGCSRTFSGHVRCAFIVFCQISFNAPGLSSHTSEARIADAQSIVEKLQDELRVVSVREGATLMMSHVRLRKAHTWYSVSFVR